MLELPDLIQQAYEEIIYLRQFRMGLIQVCDTSRILWDAGI